MNRFGGVSQPMMPRVARWLFVKDRLALATAFRKWAKEPELKRIVVSHGDVLDVDPQSVLNRIAQDIAGKAGS